MFLYATCGMVLVGASLFFVIRATVKSITKLNDKIDELVYSNGDLTKELDVHTGDEIENLANSFNNLIKYIREIVVNIADGSKEINYSSLIMADNLQGAGNAIMDISATMEEMSAGMQETSERCKL